MENDTYLRALTGQQTPHTPIWIMRQAGRYLPEYRAVRSKAGDFMTMCQSPELACEVTLQPLRRFPLDAAIIFSDILTIPDAMGLGLHFVEGEGPKFRHPVRDVTAINALSVPDINDLRYVMDAISLTRRELNGTVPLIGFSGSPWTLATYMVEGGSSKEFGTIKRLLFAEPDAAHHLLSILADAVTEYLNAQIRAGAQSLMIFDTWGGVLNPAQYREFSVQYLARIVDGLTRENEGRVVPVTLFTKGAGHRLRELAGTTCDGIGVDWTVDLATAREWVGPDKTLQGNLDPCTLYAPPDVIRAEVERCLANNPGRHVFNLGHGVRPDMDPDHIGALVEAVHDLSRTREEAA